MTREMESFVVLIVSIILFIILIPINATIALLRILKGTTSIIEKTLTFFVKSIREEIIK